MLFGLFLMHYSWGRLNSWGTVNKIVNSLAPWKFLLAQVKKKHMGGNLLSDSGKSSHCVNW